VIFLQIAIAVVGAAISINFVVLFFRCFLIEWRYYEDLGFLKYALKLGRTEEEKRTRRRALISIAIAVLYIFLVGLLPETFFDG